MVQTHIVGNICGIGICLVHTDSGKFIITFEKKELTILNDWNPVPRFSVFAFVALP